VKAPKVRPLKQISDLQPDGLNANKGTTRGRKMLLDSLTRYGAGRSVLVDRAGNIVAGNKTVEAAKDRDIMVVQTDGKKLVVVQRTDLDINSKTGRALAIADNRVGEVGLDWDPNVLKGLDVDLSIFFRDGELAKLVGTPGDAVPEPKMDQTKELRKKWKTALGQTWQIGEHRLMCADIRSLETKVDAKLMVTDPPYGVDYASLVASRGGQKKGGWPDIANDALSNEDLEKLLTEAFASTTATVAFVWHPPGPRRLSFWRALEAAQYRPAQEIIWVKNTFVFGRADYHWRHEPCIYAKREGAPKMSDRSQSSVWEVNKPQASEHPTQKPVELYVIPMTNHTEPGDQVFDPFCGSGTLLCAAETLKRKGFGVELEPGYVAVALERLSDMGLKPKLIK
jgi:DNA modification methylase